MVLSTRTNRPPGDDASASRRRPLVIVAGAGAAGMAAAIAAARAGASVCLAERSAGIGGTVTGALIHTLGGLFDARGELANAGLPAELIERLSAADPRVRVRAIGRNRVLDVAPPVYRRVTEEWLAETPRLHVLRGTRIARVSKFRRSIFRVEGSGPAGSFPLFPDALVDATGTAELTRLVDPGLVEDGSRRAAGGLIFTLRNVAPDALRFPKGVGVLREVRQAVARGELPSDCAHVWLDQGTREDEVYVKLFVPLGDGWRSPAVRRETLATAHRSRIAVFERLRRLPDFSKAEIERTGDLGVRSGGSIRGEYRLTEEDVRQGCRFPDAACRCDWPIEYWHPRTGIQLEYLPDDIGYDIPLRSLKVAGVDNLWAAGKCLSAEARAQASARCVGTCWSMGEAAGIAAARLAIRRRDDHAAYGTHFARHDPARQVNVAVSERSSSEVPLSPFGGEGPPLGRCPGEGAALQPGRIAGSTSPNEGSNRRAVADPTGTDF
ncbi:MAG: FAD-dependent oxidoreductase [Planctomycetaceae bacterium]